MFRLSRCFASAMIAVAVLRVCDAQARGSAAIALIQDDAGIVIGEPCFAIEKTITSTPLQDGTTTTRRTEERMWRDSQGRFRKQMTAVREGAEPIFHIATIIDPVSNTVTTLNLDTKTATVFHLPEHGAGALHPYVDLEDKPLMAMPGVDVKVEKLSAKQIAGVSAVGRRVTRTRPPGTVGNDKTIVSVSDRWVSPELKLLLASSMDDPRQKQTREVTQLDRTGPDPEIFKVPADFTVVDQGK